MGVCLHRIANCVAMGSRHCADVRRRLANHVRGARNCLRHGSTHTSGTCGTGRESPRVNGAELPDACPRVVLITSRFPYGTGEQFLETELPHWLGSGARLTIVPEKNDTPQIPPRPRLPGIDVDDRLRRRWTSPLWRAVAVVDTLTGPLLWRELAQVRELGRLTRPVVAFVARTGVQVALVRRFLRDHYRDADLVYTYWLAPSATAAALEHAAGTVHHTISRGHNYDLYEDKHPTGHHPFIRQVTDCFDAVQPISAAGGEFLVDRYGFRPQTVLVNRLGVTLVEGSETSSPSPSGELTVMSVSTMSRFKRLHLLIDALAVLHEQHPEMTLRWVHAGDGPLHDDLAAQVSTTLQGVDVQWLGILPHDELLEYYRNHQVDLLVNTSSSEGIPVSMMEAMAREVPVLGTDVGGVREIVPPDWLMTANPSAEHIAQTIWEHHEQVKDPRIRADMAAKVRADFDEQTNYQTFINHLIDLASRP